jgi:superfamily II DNA/RNA helicase
VLADALAGRDISGRAPTGSGKTLAFGLPLLAGISGGARRRPTALVLAPTRELASQIADELRPLAALDHRTVTPVFGGVGYGPQRRALDKGTDVVVACPGRLEDLLEQRALSLDRVEVFVVDEADRMADMGFLPAVRRIMKAASSRRQTMLFSATLDGAVTKLIAEFGLDCAVHDVGGPDVQAVDLRHYFWDVPRADRVQRVADVTAAMPSTFIFCRTRRGADRLATQLTRLGLGVAPIHGGRSQQQRTRALDSFRQGKIQALVATDVAARGIHVDDVAAVVHYDPPEDEATYLHRSGRTARAGASGVVVSFVDPGDRRATKSLQRSLGIDPGTVAPSTSALVADSPAPRRPAKPAIEVEMVAGSSKPRRDQVNGEDTRPAKSKRARSAPAGTVKFFNSSKGFGFIERPDDSDLFVHFSNIAGGGYRSLKDGQPVTFEVGRGRKGPEAVNVRPC